MTFAIKPDSITEVPDVDALPVVAAQEDLIDELKWP